MLSTNERSEYSGLFAIVGFIIATINSAAACGSINEAATKMFKRETLSKNSVTSIVISVAVKMIGKIHSIAIRA